VRSPCMPEEAAGAGTPGPDALAHIAGSAGGAGATMLRRWALQVHKLLSRARTGKPRQGVPSKLTAMLCRACKWTGARPVGKADVVAQSARSMVRSICAAWFGQPGFGGRKSRSLTELEEFIATGCMACYKLQPSQGVPHNAGTEPSPRGIADIAPGDADLCGAASCCADAVGCGEG
jgi:hypothetical protein